MVVIRALCSDNPKSAKFCQHVPVTLVDLTQLIPDKYAARYGLVKVSFGWHAEMP